MNIVLGISGSSFAEASHQIAELLYADGENSVSAVCSPASLRFVDTNLLGRFAHVILRDEDWVEPLHVDLAKSAEFCVVAPASANTLAKAAAGIADTLLAATIQSMLQRTVFFPATNQLMWRAPALESSVERLRSYALAVVEPVPLPSHYGSLDGRGFNGDLFRASLSLYGIRTSSTFHR